MSFTDSGESSKKLETTEHSSIKSCKRKTHCTRNLRTSGSQFSLVPTDFKTRQGEEHKTGMLCLRARQCHPAARPPEPGGQLLRKSCHFSERLEIFGMWWEAQGPPSSKNAEESLPNKTRDRRVAPLRFRLLAWPRGEAVNPLLQPPPASSCTLDCHRGHKPWKQCYHTV